MHTHPNGINSNAKTISRLGEREMFVGFVRGSFMLFGLFGHAGRIA